MPQIVSTIGSVASNFVAVFTAVASSIYMLSGKDKLLHQVKTLVHAFLPENLANNTLRICHYANVTICSSASFSVRPRVISLMSCSPAILPMAASWIRLASTQLAVTAGDGGDHAVVHDDGVALGVAGALGVAVDAGGTPAGWSLATEREMTLAEQSFTVQVDGQSRTACWSPVVMIFSWMIRRGAVGQSAAGFAHGGVHAGSGWSPSPW